MTQAQQRMKVGHACLVQQGATIGSGNFGLPRSCDCPTLLVPDLDHLCRQLFS